MVNPESAAGKIIHNIHERLQKAQAARNTFVGPKSAEERLLAAITGANTPIARTTESVISPERARGIVTRTEVVRNWIVNNAPSYDEEPSSRVDDEEGWAYNGGGFEISADDVTKPSSLVTPFLLSITESPSIHEPIADIWFSVLNGNEYALSIRFFRQNDTLRRRGILHEYISNQGSFEEMPEDDAIIIEDVIGRTIRHLTDQAEIKPTGDNS